MFTLYIITLWNDINICNIEGLSTCMSMEVQIKDQNCTLDLELVYKHNMHIQMSDWTEQKLAHWKCPHFNFISYKFFNFFLSYGFQLLNSYIYGFCPLYRADCQGAVYKVEMAALYWKFFFQLPMRVSQMCTYKSLDKKFCIPSRVLWLLPM